MKIKISVIIPVWNTEKYLTQCIQSIINQSIKDIEIIIIDDGSTDDSKIIIDKFASIDNRIITIHKKNEGYGNAINTGLNIVNGEYISIVESDDYVSPKMFKLLYDRSNNKKYDIIKGAFTKVYPNGRQESCLFSHLINYQYEGEVNPIEYPGFIGYQSSIWSAIYKREFLIENKIKMYEAKGTSYQDCVWKFLCYTSTQNMYFIDEPVYYYRTFAEGSSSLNIGDIESTFNNNIYLKNELNNRKLFDKIKNLYYYHYFIDLHYHYNRINHKYKKIFIKRSGKVLDEIIKLKIDIFNDILNFESDIHLEKWIRNEIKPFIFKILKYKKKGYYTRNTTKEFYKKAIKNIIKTLEKNIIIKIIYKVLKKIINNKYIKKIILKMLHNEDIVHNIKPIDYAYYLPRHPIPLVKKGKHALIISPYIELSGFRTLLDNVYIELKALGYTTHTIVYRKEILSRMHEEVSDYVYYLEDNKHTFDFLHYDINNNLRLDSCKIDEWCNNDLLQLTASLQYAYNFELCYVNYIFLSKVFTILPNNVLKILNTHDKYSYLNTRKIEQGLEKSLWYSTVPEEEKKGLMRADIVIALQVAEAEFFNNLTKSNNAHFIPYVPEKKYIQYKISNNEQKAKIGFIGSLFMNNFTAFKNFYELWLKNEYLLNNSEFIIAGEIGIVIQKNFGNQKYFIFLGTVESLDDFYTQIDLMINPDMFVSGLKIKSIDALLYGIPLFTTVAGITSIGSKYEIHNANDLAYLVKLIEKYVRNRELLNEAALYSRSVFDDFHKKNYRSLTRLIKHYTQELN